MVKEELNFYTYKELSGIIGVHENIIRKKPKKYQLKTDKKLINGRNVEVVYLTENQLQALKQDIEYNKKIFGKNQSVNNRLESVNKQKQTSEQVVREQAEKQASQPDELISFMKEVLEKTEAITNRLITAESQVKLLTTLESSKDEEINRLRAENKQLLTRVEELEKKPKKWWEHLFLIN